ncbi:MAG: GxxExxY protein [Chthoniobacterales bacterium]
MENMVEEKGVQRSPLVDSILQAAIEVHRTLGPGLLESAYEQCLAREFALRAIAFRLQVPLPVEYKGVHIDCGYRIDMVVADEVLVELKSVDQLSPVHQAQILTYLKLSGLRRSLLINFNARLLKNGIRSFLLD